MGCEASLDWACDAGLGRVGYKRSTSREFQTRVWPADLGAQRPSSVASSTSAASFDMLKCILILEIPRFLIHDVVVHRASRKVASVFRYPQDKSRSPSKEHSCGIRTITGNIMKKRIDLCFMVV